MASVALEPASGRSHAELAAIFNAGYEGYFTPFDVDEAAFRLMVETWDDDLDASRVVDGEPAGIAKLAIRGERGWIAGIGVAVAHRGTGAGEALMRGVIAEARSRGLREVWPEPVTAERAHGRIRADRTGREPWQRADESVANYTGVEGLESGRGAVLYRQSGERASLLQGVAADEGAARGLLQSLPPATATSTRVNGPEGDVFNAAIASLGGTRAHRQHELVLSL